MFCSSMFWFLVVSFCSILVQWSVCLFFPYIEDRQLCVEKWSVLRTVYLHGSWGCFYPELTVSFFPRYFLAENSTASDKTQPSIENISRCNCTARYAPLKNSNASPCPRSYFVLGLSLIGIEIMGRLDCPHTVVLDDSNPLWCIYRFTGCSGTISSFSRSCSVSSSSRGRAFSAFFISFREIDQSSTIPTQSQLDNY